MLQKSFYSNSEIKTTDLTRYRLPKNLAPLIYDLTLETSFDTQNEPFNFNGEIIIYFKCLIQTNSIIIHKSELEIIDSSIIVNSDNFQIMVSTTSYNEASQLFNITLTEMLEANNNYSIRMNYVGKFQANNFGFYKSFYTDIDGTKKYVFINCSGTC